MHARRQARNTAGRRPSPHSNFASEGDSLLRAGGESRRGTAHCMPKVAHTHPFINVALLPIPLRQSVGPPRKCTLPGDGATMGSPPLKFCCPACGFWRCGNGGLTRHRTACHGRRTDVVKTGRCELCEVTSPHLLRCPGSAGARTETWSGHWGSEESVLHQGAGAVSPGCRKAPGASRLPQDADACGR
ncbi:hypothetical protein TcCL_ESM03581 [Trypanosoma cruzi]|nr:hypothetical protein TcCL_ESM03581 [Trypanosoma cruzi]